MIILKEKPLNEILDNLSESQRILIAGCSGCAGIYQVGGRKEAIAAAESLKSAGKLRGKDWELTPTATLRQCDRQIVDTTLRPLINDYDTILSLACGVGAQTLVELFGDKIVVPRNNTMFIGDHDLKTGMSYERCRACGNCVLYETGGICPITRCAKSLLNGPCGGMSKGKCEVGGWKNDCAWVLIFNRLKQLNKMDSFTTFRPPRDFRISQPPRELGTTMEETKK